MARFISRPSGGVKKVVCTHCGGESEVAKRAMSVFCPHCKQRLILEDYTIKSYHASRLFATSGNIVVERRGIVSAPIRVHNLIIKGQVKGNVMARGCVTVASTGQLRGNVQAPRIVVDDGATVDAFLRITPDGIDEARPPGTG